ncbi:EamA family transporter [Sulfitobacter sp. SK012]|uniref:DMT family transporter n=1 Tax=Sulfitobacter sp. SK012 TaxID=1389005 RepID=UPI000E0C4FEC|nr:DMT family transporter [Sulfitobacter sp. SK012]AXI47489.1 EamA family transporter [Sulfitobacter sp. SK012]
MTRRETLFYACVLILMGAGWGITIPLTKIAVSTGYGHFGLVFWQLAIGCVIMGTVCTLRGIRLPLNPRALRLYLILALIGTILPNTAGYQAAVHLPSGILSLLLSMVPMFAFPVALLLGNDRFEARRLVGLGCGLFGVLLIVAPGAEVSLNLPLFWVAIALIPGMFYAFEGNYVAKWGTEGLDAFQVMWGATLIGVLLMGPVSVLSGQFVTPVWPPNIPQAALAASSVVHVFVYATYVWLVGRAGAVFAVQVSYLVMGFGLLWAKLILSEAYSPLIWAALAAMFLGMYLVQPRPKVALADAPAMGNTKG